MGTVCEMNPHSSRMVLKDIECKLLDNFQRGFPLVSRPFAELGRQLGVEEALVIDTLQSLQDRGLISRIGAVFRPNVVGVSTLAALAVPHARMETVAMQVSAFSEVNHNYEREHRFNLWFVVTAPSPQHLQAVLQKIEAACEAGPVLTLPLLEQFHIDLGFDLGFDRRATALHSAQTAQQATAEVAAIALDGAEQTFIGALQKGLPLVAQPFAQLEWEETDALATLSRWSKEGIIKRFGVVVRHHELGFNANAMVVWDVPDAEVSAVGRRIADSRAVSLCYRRPRFLPHWPYNLFCMIHGKNRNEVERSIATLVQNCGLSEYPHSVLFSSRRFKQCGAQYVTSTPTVANTTLPEFSCGHD